MAYLGNQPVVGDSTNTFKVLDDITSFTVTFDATSSDVVSIANDTLTFNNHRFVTGQKVTYNDGGGTAIGGLADGSYFIIKQDQNTIKLASSASNAAAGTAINLTSGAAGSSHTLNIAFDGVNTKFKATHSNGTKADISRAAQLSLSINGVIQQPQDTSTPTVGYGFESDSTIVFSTAPQNGDKIFGSFIGEAAASFDINDNTVDEFTGDGSTTAFTLSKEIPSNGDALVTVNGVVQHPTTAAATRAYSTTDNTVSFTSAPSNGAIIQVRHIGFAGASSQSVTGFYGRDGNVSLRSSDNIEVNNITASGNVTVAGVLTYEDVTNVDSVGLITARAGISVSGGDIKVGSATTLSQDNIFTTGIVTATSFVGSGANLTGVASTENIRTNTNATFLQNINVSGTTTAAGNINVSGANITLGDSGSTSDDRITLGAQSDLQIFHNGTDSVITNATGDLYMNNNADIIIKPANDVFIKPQDGESGIEVIGNGAVKLYYDNSKKIETYLYGVNISGSAKIESGGNFHAYDSVKFLAGTGEDLQLYHDGSNSYLTNNTGSMYILPKSGENGIQLVPDGAVTLYYDNSAKLATTSGGISITGNCNVDGNITLSDNEEIQFGNSTDFRIYHDSNNTYMRDVGTGGLSISGSTVSIDSSNLAEYMVRATENGSVELYHDGTKKLETASGGVTVTGTLAATAITGDGSGLSGLSVGIATEAASISGITTYLDLTKDDHELIVSGTNTISVIGGAQGTSHSLRIQNSGAANITLDSTYFKFPSGATPALPTSTGAISMISFTIHKAGAVGVNTVLLAGASVSFS